MKSHPKSVSAKVSLIDYARLASDVRARQAAEGLTLKQIAASAGIEKSKLSNLVNLRGGLAPDNLLLLCDWLGQSLYDYRLAELPAWVLERISEANDLSPEEAAELAKRRQEAARRQAAASSALEQLDLPALAEASRQTRPA